MTRYEWFRWLTFPIMPTHLVRVRKDLKKLIKTSNTTNGRYHILDVGGRKSPYTINLDADITVLDVPQESSTQEQLNLGFTTDLLQNIHAKRSNLVDVLIEDMTKCTLADESYDAVVCIEVIEHIVEDDVFVKNISKVVKKGGWAYFTTPNGDFIKNEGPDKNPDHIRHYKKLELELLLKKHFAKVDVGYAVKTGKHRVQGLKSYNLKKPLQTLSSICSNVVNRFESNGTENTAKETAHLIARAYKDSGLDKINNN